MNGILITYDQLGSIFDNLSTGVVTLSPDLKITSINQAVELITGFKAEAVVGKSCRQVFLDSLCGGVCRFHETFRAGRKSASFDLEITDENNEPHSITKIVAPLYGPKLENRGCIEVLYDRSAFQDLVRRIRHDDRRLKMILDNLDLGILTVDRGGHITFFNTMAETISGYRREDVLGKSYTAVLGNNHSRDLMVLNQSILDGKPRLSQEGEIITREGQILPIRANYMALKNEEGRIVGGLGTLTDLSLLHQFNSAIRDRYTYYDIVGRDPAMQKIFEIIPVVAASGATVLIEGPTGTGKDLLTKVIHGASPRAEKPLVKVNCAALPDNLLESEMFGYVKGAFTGADQDKPGRFQEADGGTIFLDEIGDLPLPLQAKLLRVLEDKEFYPLGGRKTVKVDVRIISATNQGLERLVGEKRFREDLFYRLNVMRFEVPPLRHRRADIPLLISHILKRLCATRNTRVEDISEEAMEVLLNYDYPGNIRELENILEHALIICQDTVIERKHLPLSLQKQALKPSSAVTSDFSLEKENQYNEKHLILAALRKNRWNRCKAAHALAIDRTTLWRKMKKYNISG